MFETRFCTHCRYPKPAAGFRPIPGGKIKRIVCESCFVKIREARKQKRAESYTG